MIIVTGASRGLGQAITKRLVESGEEVIGLARNTSGLKINVIECDVSDYASVKKANKIGNSRRKIKKTKFTAKNCPSIAIHLRLTNVFLSKLRFSPNLKRVEKFILRIKCLNLLHLKHYL